MSHLTYIAFVALITGLIVAVMVLPIVRRITRGEDSARIIALRKVLGSQKVLFIFEGMAAPEVSTFCGFTNDYPGDVYYVEYAHDGCAMDRYCLQVMRLVAEYDYKDVDILGISIGTQAFPTLMEEFGNCVNLRLFGICPYSPEVARRPQLYVYRLASSLVIPLKIILGIIGEIPFIGRDGVKLSPSELVEQGVIAIWGRPMWMEHYLVDERPVWTTVAEYHSYIRRNLRNGLPMLNGGIILARGDKLVDNNRVIDMYGYGGVPILHVPGEHADTVRRQEYYIEALHVLRLYS